VVKYSSASLDAVFGALSDPTRRAIAEHLVVRGTASVSELAEPFPVTLPAIVKHLNVLERAGLVENWKDGRTRYCRLRADPLDAASDWLDEVRRVRDDIERRVDALAEELERNTACAAPTRA
jgi:DNA-binding transcriptional ArsR family regulator